MNKVNTSYKYVKEQRYRVSLGVQVSIVLLFIMHRHIPALIGLTTLLGAPLARAQLNDKVCGQIEILEKQAKAANPSGKSYCSETVL